MLPRIRLARTPRANDFRAGPWIPEIYETVLVAPAVRGRCEANEPDGRFVAHPLAPGKGPSCSNGSSPVPSAGERETPTLGRRRASLRHCVSALTVLSTLVSHPVKDSAGVIEGAANMVGGIANVWVPVVDIDRALDFYENTLDFSVVKREGPWAEIDANGLTIGLNGREPRGAQAGGGPVI